VARDCKQAVTFNLTRINVTLGREHKGNKEKEIEMSFKSTQGMKALRSELIMLVRGKDEMTLTEEGERMT
jgi:hypothetical protein